MTKFKINWELGAAATAATEGAAAAASQGEAGSMEEGSEAGIGGEPEKEVRRDTELLTIQGFVF